MNRCDCNCTERKNSDNSDLTHDAPPKLYLVEGFAGRSELRIDFL